MRRRSISTLICTLLVGWGISGCAQPPANVDCSIDDDCFSAEGADNTSYICDWNESKTCMRACDTSKSAAHSGCLSSQYCEARGGETDCSGTCTGADQKCDPVTNTCLDACTSDAACGDLTMRNYVFCDTTNGVCRYGLCRFGSLVDGGPTPGD